MKKILVHSNYSVLNKNGNMFLGIGDKSISRFLDQMQSLKAEGLKNSILLETEQDLNLDDADGYFLIDMPEEDDLFLKKIKKKNRPIFLYTWESPLINSRNFDLKTVENFDLIFTFSEKLVDNTKFIKVNYSYNDSIIFGMWDYRLYFAQEI